MGGAPLPPVEPLPPTPKGPSLLQEYVAGSDYTWYGQLVRALPPYIDDLTTDFGDDLYDRMLWDPQVNACITILKAAILEDGVHIDPAIDDDEDEQWELAKTIHEECEQAVEDMVDSIIDSLWDMLAAIPLGNRVAEIKWEYADGYKAEKQLLNFTAIKVKPRRSTSFVVDAYLNQVGILGRPPGYPSPFLGAWLIDPKQPPTNLIPRSRFAILSHRPKDGDPRGTSILRPAYDPWWRKRQIYPEYLKYLTQFAGPSLWGTVPEGAQPQPQLDADGHPIPGAAPISPETVMAQALQQIRNGTAGAFPYGSTINAIPVAAPGARGDPFLAAIAAANIEITKTILTQQLATEEAQYQTRAAATVHEDVLDTIIRQGKLSVVRMLQRDVLRQWVLYNWGDKARRLVPKASLGITEERDRSQLIGAIASLTNAALKQPDGSMVPYIAPSQLQAIDEMLGFPVREADEIPPSIDELRKQAEEQARQAQEVALKIAQQQSQQAPAAPGERKPDESARGDEGKPPAPGPRPGGVPPAATPNHPPSTRPPVPAGGRAARMAAGSPAGTRDGATGAVPSNPRLSPEGEPLPIGTPAFTGIDRWMMAELWTRAVPPEYARLLRAPVQPSMRGKTSTGAQPR